MSRIISFNWTTPPLVAGAKTMTWRDWDDHYAQSFGARAVVAAYDRSPRVHGHQVAVIRLTEPPQQMYSHQLADDDYVAEGLAWLADHPEACPKTIFGHPFAPYLVSRERFDEFRQSGELGWVVRFDLLEVTVPTPARAMASTQAVLL